MIKPALKGRKVAYYLRILGRLSLLKVVNFCTLFVSYVLTRISGWYLFAGHPMAMSVEPTNRCQLQCPECPSGLHQLHREGGRIQMSVFKRVLDQTGGRLIFANLFFQGEPLLHPELPELIRYARKHRIFTVVSTNGNLLTELKARELVGSGLDHLIISVDGTTEEVYQSYRIGGSLTVVKEGIRRVLEEKHKLYKSNGKRGPLLELQFVVTRKNEHQMMDFITWARGSGADLYRLKTAQIYDPGENRDLLPLNPRFSRYAPDGAGGFRVKSKLANHCWRAWSQPVLSWEGQLLPCCFDKKGEYSYGRFSEETDVLGIWKSNEADVFRRRIVKKRKGIYMCNNCTEGLKI